jgi:phage FluMu protein Com
MFEIECDECNDNLLVDLKETIDSYSDNMDYIVDDLGKIIESTLQKYLVYKCPTCKKSYKFTYADWELRARKSIAYRVMEVRKQKMFREEINPQSINPDHGLEQCGQCSGYAGDGWCFVDIIKQCTIRKKDAV